MKGEVALALNVVRGEVSSSSGHRSITTRKLMWMCNVMPDLIQVGNPSLSYAHLNLVHSEWQSRR